MAILGAAIAVSACGVSSPVTKLPEIDHSRPVHMLTAKQKEDVFKEMAELAEVQHKRAASMPAISPDSPKKTP